MSEFLDTVLKYRMELMEQGIDPSSVKPTHLSQSAWFEIAREIHGVNMGIPFDKICHIFGIPFHVS